MVEKKRGKKRKDEYSPPGEDVEDKPTKDEYELAKWMRKNVPIKKTKFLNHTVEYFTAARAIDALLDSKYAKPEESTCLFQTREDIVEYLQVMLEHKFFHRARKVPVSEQELKGRGKGKDKKKDNKDSDKDDKDKDKEKESKRKEEQRKEKVTDAESSVVESKNEKEVEKEKRKRKIRLEMHNDQRFVDSLDAYVWIYEPIPFYYWIFGALLVLAAIGICLFPLWPPSVRLGVDYLSVAAAGFLVFIILLVVLRLIIFCLVWIVTAGRHHIWILPNLTEDVGFLASFWPLYKYEYKGNGNKNAGKKKKKKDKDSDAEEDAEQEDDSKQKLTSKPETTEDKPDVCDIVEKQAHRKQEMQQDEVTESPEVQASESESESSQRSSTTGRDFEIVDRDELES